MEKPLWLICITHMLIEVYLLVQVALIPVLIDEFQLNLIEASLIATVPNIIMLLMNIPSGLLADRLNPKHLLALSMIIEGAAAFLVSQTTSFTALVLGVSLLKISSPIYHVCGLSLLSRLANPRMVGRFIGYHNSFGNVGSAAGLITLAVFLSTLGWRATYLFWTLPIIAWGLILLRAQSFNVNSSTENSRVENKTRLERSAAVLSSSFVILLIAIGIREIGASGSSTYMTTFFTETRGISEAYASLIYSFGPFIGIIGSLGGGFLCEKLGAKKALSLNIFGCAVFLFLLPFMPYISLIVFTYITYSFFSSALWSPMNTLVANLTPDFGRGMGYSVYYFTEGLLASAAPTLAAFMIELTNITLIFPLSAFFLIISIVILQILPD